MFQRRRQQPASLRLSITIVTALSALASTFGVGAGSVAHEISSPIHSAMSSNGSSLPPVSALRVLEVVKSASSLSSDSSGRALYDHWTAAGHEVTLWDAATAPPADLDTAYDVVWLTNSVPVATSMAGYDRASIPVLATGLRSPHSGYGSTTPATGEIQASVYLTASGVGDPTAPSDLTSAGPVVVLDSAFMTRYVPASQLGSGRVEVATTVANQPAQLVFTRYDAGARMHVGYAPSKRGWFLTHPGSIGANARGWQFLDSLLSWAARSR